MGGFLEARGVSMKIAVCLHGYFGTVSTGNMTTGYKSEEKIKTFFGDRKVDYFIHCWQPELENTWRCLSFLYSRSKALELLEGEYDRVFIMRLDIGNVGPDDVNFPYRFDFDSDEKNMYSVYWNQLNHGLGDMWFVCNQKDAKIMSTVYEKALEYYKKDSDYVKAMLGGWPDSEWFPWGTTDAREFSNIVLSQKKTELMKYPKWYCVNSHNMYKYFFIDTGIYERTKYI
jgi:hypothetical protein